jgi:hypothetical protein
MGEPGRRADRLTVMSDQDRDHPDPKNPVADIDEKTRTAEGSLGGATTNDEDLSEVAAGKLAGNNDDFEGELEDSVRPVPGADKHHHPAHAMSKGETKHLGV